MAAMAQRRQQVMASTAPPMFIHSVLIHSVLMHCALYCTSYVHTLCTPLYSYTVRYL
jgi:hypothetical protein